MQVCRRRVNHTFLSGRDTFLTLPVIALIFISRSEQIHEHLSLIQFSL